MEKINEVVFIDVDKIFKNPNQPRTVFDESSIKELSDSIKEVGVIQPISVRKIGKKFELIAGERRLLATKKAGLKRIPSLVIEVSDNQSAVLALVENVQREDLDFVEEAYAYKALMKKNNITQKELAKRVGKSQSNVSNKLRILKLDDEIINKVKEYNLTERHTRALLSLKSKELQNEVLEKIKSRNLNVKQTDVLVKNILDDIKKDKKIKNTKYKISNRIYVNTIKKAFDQIIETGIDAKFEKNISEDYVELKIRIPNS